MKYEELKAAVKDRAIVFTIEQGVIKNYLMLQTGSGLVYRPSPGSTVFRTLQCYGDFFLTHADAMKAIQAIETLYYVDSTGEVQKAYRNRLGVFDARGNRRLSAVYPSAQQARDAEATRLEKRAEEEAKDLAQLRRKIRKLRAPTKG